MLYLCYFFFKKIFFILKTSEMIKILEKLYLLNLTMVFLVCNRIKKNYFLNFIHTQYLMKFDSILCFYD